MKILTAKEVVDKYYNKLVGKLIEVHVFSSEKYRNSPSNKDRPSSLYHLQLKPFNFKGDKWLSHWDDKILSKAKLEVKSYYMDYDYNYFCGILVVEYMGFKYELAL